MARKRIEPENGPGNRIIIIIIIIIIRITAANGGH